MLTTLLLVAPLLVAQAAPPTRGYSSVPTQAQRTTVITITPPPTIAPGTYIITTPRSVTVCTLNAGGLLLCTGPGK